MFCWLDALKGKVDGNIEQKVMRILNKGFNLRDNSSKIELYNTIGKQFSVPINLEVTDTACIIKDEFNVTMMSFFKHSTTGKWVTR